MKAEMHIANSSILTALLKFKLKKHTRGEEKKKERHVFQKLRVDFFYLFVFVCCGPLLHLASVLLYGFSEQAELKKASSIVTEAT